MKQVANPKGSTVAEFVEAYNEVCAELSRATIERVQYVSEREALIFYEDPEIQEPTTEYEFHGFDHCVDIADPEEKGAEVLSIRITVPDPGVRFCCECENYDWGRGCPYRSGHVKLMDPCCRMFNINIYGGTR